MYSSELYTAVLITHILTTDRNSGMCVAHRGNTELKENRIFLSDILGSHVNPRVKELGNHQRLCSHSVLCKQMRAMTRVIISLFNRYV